MVQGGEHQPPASALQVLGWLVTPLATSCTTSTVLWEPQVDCEGGLVPPLTLSLGHKSQSGLGSPRFPLHPLPSSMFPGPHVASAWAGHFRRNKLMVASCLLLCTLTLTPHTTAPGARSLVVVGGAESKIPQAAPERADLAGSWRGRRASRRQVILVPRRLRSWLGGL